MNHVRLCIRRSYVVRAALVSLTLFSSEAHAQSISFKSAPASPVRAGAGPSSVATGDFNGDGQLDFAVANAGDNTASVLLGNGDGTFTPAGPVTVNRNPFPTPCLFTRCGSVPLAIAVGDFNRDGKQDLAVTNIPLNDLCSIGSVFGAMCSSVAVLLGNGDGSFQASNQYDPGGQLPTSIAAGDFNNDGNQDLAISNLNSSSLSILLGDGTGRSFRQASRSPLSVGRRPVWVAQGYFNADATIDLAVANADDGTVSILLGNGDGSFAVARGAPIAVGTRPTSIAVADFNRDGTLDLAVTDFTDSVVWVLLGNADGTFGAPARFGVGAQPSSLTAADWNNDGYLDLVVANRRGNSISILRGNGNGSFVLTRTQAVGLDPQSVAAEDFNHDNEMDLLVAATSTNSVSVLLNATDVVAPTTLATASPGPNANGWNKTIVAVSLAAADNPGGSGVREVRYTIANNSEVVVAGASAAFTLTTQSTVPISYFAVDNAGNAETAHLLTVRIDSSAPTISSALAPPANAAGWDNNNVTVSFSCADALSGIAACTSPVTISAEGANQTVNGRASDLAGNSATTARTVSLDKTPPSLTLPVFALTYLVNSSLTLNFSASDSLAGLASMSATLNGAPVSSGSSVILSHAGTNTFTLAATDVAGNTATQTSTFSVLYNFSGFLAPISNDGTSVYKLGSTAPVKFQLTDGNASRVSGAIAHLAVQRLSNESPVGSPIDPTASGAADAGNLFRYDGSQYIYNLDTTTLAVGTWQLQALLDDGTVHIVTIGLR
jgi:hypothetical protein